jgi:hypothetical protein
MILCVWGLGLGVGEWWVKKGKDVGEGKKNQEAVTVIGTLVLRVKGVLGLGGRASAPKGVDIL